MCSHRIIAALLVLGGSLGAQSGPTAPAAAPTTRFADSLTALRARYDQEIRTLIPRWKAASLGALREDSLRAIDLPSDTLQVGSLRFLIDRSQAEVMQQALTRAWSELTDVFGREANALSTTLFVARLRSRSGRPCSTCPYVRKDTAEKVIDLAELHPGRLDIFDRVGSRESADVIAERIASRGARMLVQNGDSTLRQWLIEPISLGTPSMASINQLRATLAAASPRRRELAKGLERQMAERMHADLVTAPSQVASRCLTGDFRRCRDALGLSPTADPLTEWYDPAERRALVLRMKELLAVGPQLEQYHKCVDENAYAVCDRILRAIPRFVVPPALPVSARHHFFRIALATGGSDAYSRVIAVPSRPLEDRISDGARLPIDSVVARWRADVLAARPAAPTPSLLSVWTAVGWGLAVALASLRFASWR